MNTRHYHEYYTEDLHHPEYWVRAFCVPVVDVACGILLFQHHFTKVSDVFDHSTEANLGLVTAKDLPSALRLIGRGQPDLSYNPSVVRRVARLLQNDTLNDNLLDTIAERGLERLIAEQSDKSGEGKFHMLVRAGWSTEQRGSVTVNVLEL